MEVDEALALVGGARRWHLLMLVLLGLSMFFPLCWQGLSIVFIGTCVCVCACVFICVRARACVRACMRSLVCACFVGHVPAPVLFTFWHSLSGHRGSHKVAWENKGRFSDLHSVA